MRRDLLPERVANSKHLEKLRHGDWQGLAHGERSSREAVYKQEVLPDCFEALVGAWLLPDIDSAAYPDDSAYAAVSLTALRNGVHKEPGRDMSGCSTGTVCAQLQALVNRDLQA